MLVNPTTGAYLYDSYASALPPGTQVPLYLLDDPVTVDGGGGTSSLYVLETTIEDAFNLSVPGSVFGAGVSVSFTNLADGPYIVAPTPSQQSQVNVNGNPVVARSLLGISALLAAELFGTNQTPVNQNPYLLSDPITGALGYYIASATTGQIIITQPGGSTTVSAPGAGPAGSSSMATYTVQLASAPTADVWVTLSVASASSPIVLISVNGGVSYGSEEVIEFTPADWNVPVTVTVEAIASSAALYGRFFATIMTSSESADPNYNHVDTEDVIVNVEAIGQAGVDVSQPAGGPTVLTGTPPYGIDSSYSLWLANAPAPGTTVTVTLGFNASALVLSSTDPRYNATTHTVTFNSTNWNVPVTIVIAAYVTNYGLTGPATITETVTSTDPAYTAWFDLPRGAHHHGERRHLQRHVGASHAGEPASGGEHDGVGLLPGAPSRSHRGRREHQVRLLLHQREHRGDELHPQPELRAGHLHHPGLPDVQLHRLVDPRHSRIRRHRHAHPTDPNQPLMFFPPRYDRRRYRNRGTRCRASSSTRTSASTPRA